MKPIASILLSSFIPFCVYTQTVVGRILNESSQPLANARLHLLNTSTIVLTDAEGRFAITKVERGTYTAVASATFYAEKFLGIFVNEGNTTLPDIILNPDFRELGEVLVSSEKKEQSLRSIPASISAISSKDIELFQLRNSREITAITPNLYSANPGDNRNVTSVRGIVSTSYDPAVTTYIDGVNQFNLDTYIAELLDVERIEVLRGPQGTLYGRNSMGGVINIITRPPAGNVSGMAEINAGNYGFQRYTAALNLPLIKHKLVFRLAGMYNKLNGYYVNQFDDSHYDRQHSGMINSSLKYFINSHWSAEANVKSEFNRNDGAFALVFARPPRSETPYKLNQDAVGTMVDNIVNGSIRVNYEGPQFTFSSLSSYQCNYRYYKDPIDADFSPLDAISIYNNYGRGWNSDKVLAQEFKFNSPANKHSRFGWTAGSYVFYQRAPVRQSTIFGKDATQAGIQDSLFSIENVSKGTAKGHALFGHITIAASQNVEFIAGLRYDHERKELSVASHYHKQNFSSPITADTSAEANFNVLSPKIVLLYKVTNKTNFYFNYSRGFRAGGLTQLSSDPSQPPLFPYRPEYSNNAEVGMKTQPFDNLQLNLAVFYTTVEDAQIPVLILPDAITVTKNAGSLKSAGFESELKFQILNGLRLTHNFGFTRAIFGATTASQGGQQIDIKGNNQLFTPNVTSFLNIRYQHSIDRQRNVKFEASAQWLYIGRQYFDIANTIVQPGYNLINTNAGLVFRKLHFFFWTKNLTDTRFVDYAYDFGGLHLGNPFTFGIGASITFLQNERR